MKKLLFISIMTMLVFVGCRSTQPLQNNFFLLELPPVALYETAERVKTIDGTFEVQRVEVAPAYASHQIAVREDTHRIRYFSFNEWAHRPALSLTNMTFSFLEEGRFFREIVTGRLHGTPDFVLKTMVRHMEVDHQSDVFEARLVVEFRLLNAETEEIILHHRADRNRLLDENSLNLFAAAVSELFAEELHAFVDLVYEKLDN